MAIRGRKSGKGRNLLQALEREIQEETSLSLIRCKFLRKHEITKFYPGIGRRKIVRNIFLCEAKGKIKLSEEHCKYAWVSKNDIKKLRTIDDIDLTEFLKF